MTEQQPHDRHDWFVSMVRELGDDLSKMADAGGSGVAAHFVREANVRTQSFLAELDESTTGHEALKKLSVSLKENPGAAVLSSAFVGIAAELFVHASSDADSEADQADHVDEIDHVDEVDQAADDDDASVDDAKAMSAEPIAVDAQVDNDSPGHHQVGNDKSDSNAMSVALGSGGVVGAAALASQWEGLGDDDVDAVASPDGDGSLDVADSVEQADDDAAQLPDELDSEDIYTAASVGADAAVSSDDDVEAGDKPSPVSQALSAEAAVIGVGEADPDEEPGDLAHPAIDTEVDDVVPSENSTTTDEPPSDTFDGAATGLAAAGAASVIGAAAAFSGDQEREDDDTPADDRELDDDVDVETADAIVDAEPDDAVAAAQVSPATIVPAQQQPSADYHTDQAALPDAPDIPEQVRTSSTVQDPAWPSFEPLQAPNPHDTVPEAHIGSEPHSDPPARDEPPTHDDEPSTHDGDYHEVADHDSTVEAEHDYDEPAQHEPANSESESDDSAYTDSETVHHSADHPVDDQQHYESNFVPVPPESEAPEASVGVQEWTAPAFEPQADEAVLPQPTAAGYQPEMYQPQGHVTQVETQQMRQVPRSPEAADMQSAPPHDDSEEPYMPTAPVAGGAMKHESVDGEMPAPEGVPIQPEGQGFDLKPPAPDGFHQNQEAPPSFGEEPAAGQLTANVNAPGAVSGEGSGRPSWYVPQSFQAPESPTMPSQAEMYSEGEDDEDSKSKKRFWRRSN